MLKTFKLGDVTYSNMKELIQGLREKDGIGKICSEHGLNLSLLRELFMNSSQGYNNVEIAQKMGVHRVTIQRYSAALKNMDRDEFLKLWNFVVRGNEK